MTPLHLSLDAVADWREGDGLVRARALMPPSEVQRGEAFRRSVDRDRFTVTRAAVRLALTRVVPDIPPTAWCFEANPWGRPMAAGPKPGPVFNLSHTEANVRPDRIGSFVGRGHSRSSPKYHASPKGS